MIRRNIFIEEPSRWLIAFRTIAAMVSITGGVLAASIIYAVYSGHYISFFGVSIGQTDRSLLVRIETLEQELAKRPTRDEVKRLKTDAEKAKAEAVNALVPSDLPDLWEPRESKAQIIGKITAMSKMADAYNEVTQSMEFVFVELEHVITRSGGYINTNEGTESGPKFLRLIQTALASIDAFEGTPDGDQSSTNKALEAFQATYNAGLSPDEIQLRPLGFFGPRTLSIMRDRYWRHDAGT